MTYRLAFPAFLIVALLTGHELHAACTDPVGAEGESIYNGDFHTMQFCNGTKWISMAASGTATEVDPHVGTLTNGKWCSTNGSVINCTNDAPIGGGGTLSLLSDVTVTSPVNGNVLTYNGSKWVNVGAGSAMGTTTMLAGWPDAIFCIVSGQRFTYYLMAYDGAANQSYFTLGGSPYTVTFNDSFNYVGGTSTGDCANKSISQLYALGRAFNFIGSSLASAAAPAGGVQFNNGSGALAADNSLVWDNTGKKLGIGTAAPATTLHVNGTVTASTVTGLSTPSHNSDAATKAYVDAAGGGGAAFTVWGATTCPNGYTAAYTGTAISMVIGTYAGGGGPICSASVPSTALGAQNTGWMTGNTVGGDSVWRGTVTCAVCYK